jgi:putative flippase GtrA
MTPLERLERLPGVGALLRHRFMKFGTVGALGTLVNLGVLYLGQEFLFTAIQSPGTRLNASLALAILCATISNFAWNRYWTWRDRHPHVATSVLVQFAQYTLASWLGIAIQIIVTKLLAVHIHYLVANVAAIVVASLFNFVVNDFWTFGRFRLRPGKAHAAAMPARAAPAAESAARLGWYLCVSLLAVFTYFYGLQSQHIPKNGDEYVYTHITRVTADSARLLPLQSELDGMRNTKPPLVFWQGIASTERGEAWTLWNLRYPSVLYTLLTALMVFVLGFRISGRLEPGFVGALAYLAFFSTYRYGRPFLTNAPEVFWLSLPFFLLAFTKPAGFASRRLVPACIGITLGIAFLYKSFALAVPAAAGLAWWYLHERRYRVGLFLRRDVPKLVIAFAIALGLFALWFVFDPDPRAIWQEFVVGENMGKLDPSQSYLGRLLWGGSSIWRLALGYPENAGLLAVPVIALVAVAFLRRRHASDDERLLWIWVIALFAAFSVPSQRSSRYLLAAMPFIAVLLALYWERIPRAAFAISLAMTGAAVAFLAFLAYRLDAALPDAALYAPGFWILVAVALALVVGGLVLREFTRPAVTAAILLGFLTFAAFLRPFDGALGTYSAEVQAQAAAKDVWVPCNFRAKYERYRFLLPGANVLGYREDAPTPPLARTGLVAVQVPLGQVPCKDCTILGRRLDLKGRHDPGEIRDMLRGNVFPHLFVEEFLVDASSHAAATRTGGAASECR